MTNLKLHTLIEQNLQNIGSFAYQDMLPEEVDLQINYVIDWFIRNTLDAYQKKQSTLEDLRTITEKNYVISMLQDSSGTFTTGSLPDGYLYLINDRSIVNVICRKEGKLVRFSKEVANRLDRTSDLYNILDHSFSKTRKTSPVSILNSNNIIVYLDGFIVPSVKIDYIRKPIIIDVVLNPNDQFEFPDGTFYKIAELTSKRIAILIEESQQKIVNLQ